MDLTFAHYRNRFCMFRTYYALAVGVVKADAVALLVSARYPRIEFTFTEKEQKLAEAEMELLLEVGQIPRRAPVASLFAM